ncbi:MAG: PAS domain S-box protein [Anaerolineaceae bacterium]|nr:PAS domain S-box protein [Anaerolineaceae bacterium]
MNKKFFRYELRIAIIYWLFGILWIFVTDDLLVRIIQDPIVLTRIQNLKGWVFVTASTIIIYAFFYHFFSKQRQIQKSLQENEEKFRTIFESANVGKSLTSLSGEISVNQAFADMLGYSREELTHRTWQSLTPPEDIEVIQAYIDELFASGKDSTRFKKRYFRKDGSIIWADVSVVLFCETSGKPLNFITTIVDITDQKHTEESLKYSHDLMRYIIEHDRSAVAVHDKDLNYIFVSQRYLQDYNVKEKDVIGKHHYAVFPDLPQKWRDVHQRALAGEVLSAEDDPYYRDDGSMEWTRWECRPWYEGDGSIGGIIVYTEVITQRKQMEHALRESEERLRLAVESAQQGIYDLEVETKKVTVNDIYASMLGYDPETFIETFDSWRERLHPDDAEQTTNYLQDYLNGLIDRFQIEFRMRTAKGDHIWVLSIGKIVEYDVDNKPKRMLGTHTNITELKKLETEKNLFSNLFENSLNEIYLFDAKSLRFKQVNKAALDNLGYSEEEIYQFTPLDIKPYFNLDDFDALIEPLKKAESDLIVFETMHQRKDGSHYPVEVHLQLQKIENEPIFAAIILDISERKRAQEVLLSERERLSGIIEGTNVGTWEWNIQTGETILNNRWAEIIGYTLDELSPTTIDTWSKFAHPDDLAASNEAIQKHINGDYEYYEMEARMKHKEGHWVWVLDRGKVTSWSEDGKPILMQGTHQDITQRKNNEAKINEQLEELRRWHAMTLGREERILELKKEINKILADSGLPPRYTSVNE